MYELSVNIHQNKDTNDWIALVYGILPNEQYLEVRGHGDTVKEALHSAIDVYVTNFDMNH
jgi:hypothetical protein